jgi:hypothetical protein
MKIDLAWRDCPFSAVEVPRRFFWFSSLSDSGWFPELPEIPGDLDCGAITAVLAHEADLVIWRDFAHSWPDWKDGGAWQHDEEPFRNWPEMQFASDAYRAAIENRPSPVVETD